MLTPTSVGPPLLEGIVWPPEELRKLKAMEVAPDGCLDFLGAAQVRKYYALLPVMYTSLALGPSVKQCADNFKQLRLFVDGAYTLPSCLPWERDRRLCKGRMHGASERSSCICA